MLKKVIFIITFILLSTSIFSQSNINNYKYVIVPKTFDFLKSEDQFKLNSLSKFLFEKYGFEVMFDDEPLPQDLINNGCLGLFADVIKESGVFKTKLVVELTNCRKKVVYVSHAGESSHKKSEVAYNMALREAFESFKMLNYQYQPTKVDAVGEGTSEQKEIVRLQAEIKTLKNDSKIETTQSESKIDTSKPELVETLNSSNVFTAKLKGDGVLAYDLIDENGLIVYTILFSGKEDVYIVKDENAIIYKLNNNWVIAKSKLDNSLDVKSIQITF